MLYLGQYLHEKVQQAITDGGENPAKTVLGEVDSGKPDAKSSPCPPEVQAENPLYQIPRYLCRLYRIILLRMGKNRIQEAGGNTLYRGRTAAILRAHEKEAHPCAA